ncbi:MAG TPA: hypothetical protein VGD42_18880 [Lysobacter sp.]
MKLPALASLLLASFLLSPMPVRAETVNCINITSLPATLTTQGVYCLKQNLATAISEGQAIDIQNSNVTLDCNGYKIGGLGAGVNTNARGIYSSGNANITVRNCNVRGFVVGIALFGLGFGSSGHLVENNRLDGNTMVGMDIQGDGSIIRGNLITANGGGSRYSEPGYSSRGIQSLGDSDVLDNTVWGMIPLSGGVRTLAINAGSNDGGSIEGNRVRALAGSDIQAVRCTAGCNRVRIVDNSLAGSSVATSVGVGCEVSSDASSIGNRFSGFTTTIDTCHSGGGNLSIP